MLISLVHLAVMAVREGVAADLIAGAQILTAGFSRWKKAVSLWGLSRLTTAVQPSS